MNKTTGKRAAAFFSSLLMLLSLIVMPLKTALADGDNPQLATLSVKYGDKELLEGFSQSTYSYTIDVKYATDKVDVNAAPQTEGDTVSGTGDGIELTAGTGTLIKVIVSRGSDGDPVTTEYDITINRALASNDAGLKSLSVKHGNTELLDKSTPGLTFDPGTTSYTINTDAMYLDVTAAADDSNAAVTGYLGDDKVTQSDGKWAFALSDGENDIKFTVTAEDGTTSKDYKITVNCDSGSDAYLKTLTVSFGSKQLTLTPGFSPDHYDYSLEVRNEVVSLDLAFDTENPNAEAFYDGGDDDGGDDGDYAVTSPVFLEEGVNTITIDVYSEDTQNSDDDSSPDKEYTLTITRDAGNVKSYNGFKYEDEGSYILISGYSGTSDNITIPGTINSKPVTTIGQAAFIRNTALKSVTLPSSITEIESLAFLGCSRLQSVTLPQGLEMIGDDAFEGCWKLSSAVLPDSVVTLGEGCFMDCTSLTGVAIPDNVKTIGDCAFEGDTALTAITTGSNPNFSGQDGVLFALSGGKPVGLIAYPAGKTGDSYTIPDTVNTLGYGAFDSCKLKTVSVPSGVTELPAQCFANCTNLTGFTVPKGVRYIDYYSGVFTGDTSLAAFSVDPDNETFTVDGEGVLYDSEYGDDDMILMAYPAGNTEDSYTIPSGVDEIASTAFSMCPLKNIVMDDDLWCIDSEAFSECNNLTSVVIPDGVGEIDEWAFVDCPNLCALTVGSGVYEMDLDSVIDCPKLAAVYFFCDAPEGGDDGGAGIISAGKMEMSHKDAEAYNQNRNIKALDDYGLLFSGCSKNLTVYRASGTLYFTKNTWNGRPLKVFNPYSTCTVTFNMNGKAGDAPEAETVYQNCKAVQPLDPVSSGFAFVGWYKDAACKTKWNFATDTVTGSKTLYAKWDIEQNAYLKAIDINLMFDDYKYGSLSLDQDFSPLVNSYTAHLSETEDTFTVAPEVSYSGAAVTVDGHSGSNTYTLANGKQVKINIVVKSGSLINTYKLTVTRAVSTDNYLYDLSANAGTFAEAVYPWITEYHLELPEDAGTVSITPTINTNAKATPSTVNVTLNNDQTKKVTLSIKSQAGKTNKYTIFVHRAKSTVTDLNSLKTNSSKYPVTPALDNTKTDGYTVMLPDNVSSVTLSAAAKGYGASAVFTNLTNPGAQKNGSMVVKVPNSSSVQVKVTVTAQDTTKTKDYTITVYRAPKLSGFSATPKSGSYPTISPGGDNRITFSWILANQSEAKIEIQVGAAWKTIYADTAMQNAGKTYTYSWDGKVDGSYLTQGTYNVRISAGSDCGTSSYSTLKVKVLAKAVPVVTVTPNIIASGGKAKTKISVKLNVFTLVKIEVYNSANELVRTLTPNGYQSAGTTTVYWDGTDGSGVAVHSGDYTVVVTAGAADPVISLLYLL